MINDKTFMGRLLCHKTILTYYDELVLKIQSNVLYPIVIRDCVRDLIIIENENEMIELSKAFLN